jgi:hypothetical protein
MQEPNPPDPLEYASGAQQTLPAKPFRRPIYWACASIGFFFVMPMVFNAFGRRVYEPELILGAISTIVVSAIVLAATARLNSLQRLRVLIYCIGLIAWSPIYGLIMIFFML